MDTSFRSSLSPSSTFLQPIAFETRPSNVSFKILCSGVLCVLGKYLTAELHPRPIIPISGLITVDSALN